ncbi:MAG: hypothetical protein QM661_04060 [Solimonas sp.]
MVALIALAIGGVAFADIDLSDFDDDLMQGMDDAVKSFEPNLAAKNGAGALEDAAILRDGYVWTEQYFAAKGGTDDAVRIAKQGLDLIDQAVAATKAQDFDAAATSARAAAKTCRSCHDLYKPLTK